METLEFMENIRLCNGLELKKLPNFDASKEEDAKTAFTTLIRIKKSSGYCKTIITDRKENMIVYSVVFDPTNPTLSMISIIVGHDKEQVVDWKLFSNMNLTLIPETDIEVIFLL